ncbi:hypothetical protein G7D34_003693 [Salmonella enterica]|nr:hypothetical protein [Salmonella enterica]
MSDMYFDPTEFDFTSLVDVVEHNEKPTLSETYKPADVGADGGLVETIEDLPEQETLETESDDPNQNINDILYTDEEKAQASEDFNYLPDDYLIDFGGRKATKAEINEKLAMIEETEQKADFVNAIYEKSEQGTRWLMRESGVSVRAIDQEINDIVQEMNSAPNETLYGAAAKRLVAKQQQREKLYADVDQAFKVDAAIRDQAVAHNTFEVNNRMNKKYSDFTQVMSKATEEMKAAGFSMVQFERSYNPWIAEKIYKATKAGLTEDDRVKKAYSLAEQRSAARSQANSTTNPKSVAQDAGAAELSRLRNLANKRGLTKEENRSLFKHLKD